MLRRLVSITHRSHLSRTILLGVTEHDTQAMGCNHHYLYKFFDNAYFKFHNIQYRQLSLKMRYMLRSKNNNVSFEDIASTYEKEDVQIDYLMSILESSYPNIIWECNVNIGDSFARVSSSGKVYTSHKTTDADIIGRDSKTGLIIVHIEITHLGDNSYRQIDEIIYAFKQCRKRFQHQLAPNFMEVFIQHGGMMLYGFEPTLQQEGIVTLYIERTVDKLLHTDDIELQQFLCSSFKEERAESLLEQNVQLVKPVSSASSLVPPSMYSALEYPEEVAIYKELFFS